MVGTIIQENARNIGERKYFRHIITLAKINTTTKENNSSDPGEHAINHMKHVEIYF